MPVLVPISTLPSDQWPALPPAWQLEIGGLTIGAGTAYQIREDGIDGLDLPGLRTSDMARPQDHGLFYGADYLSGRQIAFSISVLGDSPGATLDLLDALAAVWQPLGTQAAIQPLTLRLPGIDPRVLFGRPRRRVYDTADLRAGHVKATLGYESADPRIYSADETFSDASVPVLTGGLVWPIVWPIVWGSGSAGVGSAVNAGNFSTRPVATFTGPLTGPRLQNATVDKTFRMDDSFDLPAGQTLVVDFDARTVLLGGTSSRYADVAADSEWWELVPGTNEIRLSAFFGSGTAQLRYRSAWL